MSKELKTIKVRDGSVRRRNITLNQFYGGAKRGTLIQVTQGGVFLQLTLDEALDLGVELLTWSTNQAVKLAEQAKPKD